jgi:hypothetical protein
LDAAHDDEPYPDGDGDEPGPDAFAGAARRLGEDIAEGRAR